MPVNVNRITNCNVYVEGIGLLGMAEEVKVPGVKGKMTDHKGLGMVGTAEFPAGLDKLEASVKWVSIYPVAEQLLSSTYYVNQYQVRANIETYNSLGILAQTPGVWMFSGSLKDAGALTFKVHENVDKTTLITVYNIEQWIGGVQTLLYDALANIYIVNGVDQLAQYRQNIGDGLGNLGVFGV